MMEKEMLKKTVKEIWEKEKGIKCAFYNASQMFLMLSQNEEENERYLDLLWGGIVGVLSASAINEYAELEFDYKDEGIEVYVFIDDVKVSIDRFNRDDKWVDVYKNGTAQYWEMSRY